jgi:uncharacterized YccA/Bax inhibitor family protein
MRSANPAFSGRTFRLASASVPFGETMTVNGTIHRTLILLLCVLATAAWTWTQFFESRDPATVYPYLLGGAIGGMVVGFVTVFKQQWSPFTAPIYALLEGLFLGGISALFELRFPGIALESVALTFGVCFCMLVAYRTGLLRATQKFTLGVIAATGAIMLLYLVTMLLGFFGVQVPAIYGSGPIGILFSLAVVVIASLNQGAPKYMEWYGAFGLMVTLVWLYLEMLRLLAKFRGRR